MSSTQVGLWQVDGTLPNLALMKLSAWLGGTVLQTVPDETTRYASVIFTKNRGQVEFWKRAYDFEAGGSGWDLAKWLPDEAEAMVPDYSLYPDCNYAMGYLSRGCIRRCKFCLVPEKEGRLRQVAEIGSLVRDGNDKLMLLDNNLLGLSNALGILQELADRGLRVNFNQGLDIRLVTPEKAQVLAGISYFCSDWHNRSLHFAFDHPCLKQQVVEGIQILGEAGIAAKNLAFYVLVGFDTTLEEDVSRCEVLRGYGVRPYVMRYRKTPQLNALARWANAPAGMWRKPFAEYRMPL